MSNDVHAPPPAPKLDATPVHRSVGGQRPRKSDRVHVLERSADRHGGTKILFTDPEDSGDSFNTMMSAVIAGSVLDALGVVAWLMWK